MEEVKRPVTAKENMVEVMRRGRGVDWGGGFEDSGSWGDGGVASVGEWRRGVVSVAWGVAIASARAARFVGWDG